MTFSSVRVGLHWMVTKWWFDGFIMFVILLSSAALAAEDPVQENSPRNKMLAKFDYAFTAIFFIECFLKVSERRLKMRLFALFISLVRKVQIGKVGEGRFSYPDEEKSHRARRGILETERDKER